MQSQHPVGQFHDILTMQWKWTNLLFPVRQGVQDEGEVDRGREVWGERSLTLPSGLPLCCCFSILLDDVL